MPTGFYDEKEKQLLTISFINLPDYALITAIASSLEKGAAVGAETIA